MTANKLLTGEDGPLSSIEYIYWNQYFARKVEMEKEANKAAKKGQGGKATQEFKRTMGGNRT